jgi:hypothetical protein
LRKQLAVRDLAAIGTATALRTQRQAARLKKG